MMETYSLADRMMIESGLTPFPKTKKDGGPGLGNHGNAGRTNARNTPQNPAKAPGKRDNAREQLKTPCNGQTGR